MTNFIKKKDINGTAKLNNKLFFNIGNGSINVTKNAMNFMLFTINYVARDGRIVCNNETIRSSLHFQNRTFNSVIEHLKSLELLSEKDGYLYSHFHVLPTGDRTMEYLQNLSVFSSSKVFALSKTQKRFLFYIAAATKIGSVHSINVESLYKNQYQKYVISYFENYQDLTKTLFTLVEQGLLEVLINKKWYNDESVNFKEVFNTYCGYDADKHKKSRMNTHTKHIIGLRVNEKITNEVRPNKANYVELENLSYQNYIAYDLISEKTLNYIIGIQNELFSSFGLFGLSLYREALEGYFSTAMSDVYYHEHAFENSKVVNTLVDFYLLPNLIGVITRASSSNEPISDIDKFFNEPANLSQLVKYYLEKAKECNDHIILLEEALERNGVSIKDLTKIPISKETVFTNAWTALDTKVDGIYQSIAKHLHAISPTNLKAIVRAWAKEGIISQRILLGQAIELVKKEFSYVPYELQINVSANESRRNVNKTKVRHPKQVTTKPAATESKVTNNTNKGTTVSDDVKNLYGNLIDSIDVTSLLNQYARD